MPRRHLVHNKSPSGSESNSGGGCKQAILDEGVRRSGISWTPMTCDEAYFDKYGLCTRPDCLRGIPELRDLLACFPQRTDVPIGHVFSALSRAHRLAQSRNDAGAVRTNGREEIASSTRRISGSPLPSRRCFTTLAAADDAALLGGSASSSVAHHTATTLRLVRLGSWRRSNSLVTTEEHAEPPLPPPPHP